MGVTVYSRHGILDDCEKYSVKKVCQIFLVTSNPEQKKFVRKWVPKIMVEEVFKNEENLHEYKLSSVVNMVTMELYDKRIEEQICKEDVDDKSWFILMKTGDEWCFKLKITELDKGKFNDILKLAVSQNYERMVRVEKYNEQIVKKMKKQNNRLDYYELHDYYKLFKMDSDQWFFYLKKLAVFDRYYLQILVNTYDNGLKRFRNKGLSEKIWYKKFNRGRKLEF